MHYRIAMPSNPAAAKVLRETLVWLRREKPMQADLARLTQACCKPKKGATLANAPVPERQRFFDCAGAK